MMKIAAPPCPDFILHNSSFILCFALTDADQRSLFAFLGHLPRTCKALLTSRSLVIATGRRLKLQQLDQTAALQTLADIARDNPALAAAPVPDRLRLITETGGNTLLLTWTAWQVGSGYCTTIADAFAHLRSCPQGNDPLEFIFGDLLARFTPEEERIVATLSYPTEPIPVTAIAEISGVDDPTTRRALKLLTNRSIIVPQEGEEKYALVPMVAEFIRHAQREVVKQMGMRLADRASRLLKENGYIKNDTFPLLDAAWPTIRPALRLFLDEPNDRLQDLCTAMFRFLDFTGRWDEVIFLCVSAEKIAAAACDRVSAGKRAYDIGYIYYRRRQAGRVLDCADRVASHWQDERIGVTERTDLLHLQGHGHFLNQEYPTAIAVYREVLELHRAESFESEDVAIDLNWLANAEYKSGNLEAAEQGYREVLRVAQSVGYTEGVSAYTGNLAKLALDQEKWLDAEVLAHNALTLSQLVGRHELIASNCCCLSTALVRQGRTSEALIHAQRAVEIYSRLNSPDLGLARAVAAECEASGRLAGSPESIRLDLQRPIHD